MAATLRDVARLAGVSKITASRAIRGAPNVAPATVGKVLAAARMVGYTPNRLAGALAGTRSTQVGAIVPSMSNIVFADVLAGLDASLDAHGYHSILAITRYDPEREERMVRSVLSWRPAGIVIAPTRLSDTARRLLRESALPVVEIMDLLDDPIDMNVGNSHRAAGAIMAGHLLSRGYRSFGYVGHDLQADPRAAIRLAGFREALAEQGVAIRATALLAGKSSIELGRRGLAQLLDGNPGLDAVYFSNDDMAVGGVFECMHLGIDVPAQLAIAGFNGLEIGQNLPRRLTTVGSNRRLIGRRSAELILRRLAGETPDRQVDVGITLIEGETA